MIVAAMPWEELEDAESALLEAERYGSADVKAAAQERVLAARQRMGAIGEALVRAALDNGSTSLLQMLDGKFGEVAAEAYEKARLATKRARQALDLLDAVKVELKELRKLVDNVTPGVGIPEYDVGQISTAIRKLHELAGRVRVLEAKK